jgi:hypothetical protein
MMEWIILVLAMAGAWFWLDSLRCREIALAAGERACAAQGLQFLDWTVAQMRLRPERDGEGRVRLRRVYRFEYSETGDDRLQGSVRLLGRRVEEVQLARQLLSGDNVIPLH